jgi:hypothetical protein
VAIYQALTGKPSTSLPAVVARVGNENLSPVAFTRLEGVVRYSNGQRNLGMTEGQIRKSALDRFVRVAAMQQRATAEGIVVTDAEVTSWISDQAARRAALFQHDAQALADFNAMIAAYGEVNAAAYDHDPRTIAAVRKMILMGKLIERHLGSNAPPDRVESFVQQVIAQAKPQFFISSN